MEGINGISDVIDVWFDSSTYGGGKLIIKISSSSAVNLTVEQARRLRDYCDRFVTFETEREGRARAKEVGEEYCKDCNGPCMRKGAFYEEDED